VTFAVGDTVFYPGHGAGRILEVAEQEFLGKWRRFYRIRVIGNDMTVMVPVDGSEKAGLRPVISGPMVEEVVGVLREGPTKMPLNWNNRVKHNRDKIKSGDILQMADVVRNLALRDHEKGLSTGERQMFSKVKRILASELMFAKEMREDDALSFLDGILSEICACRPSYAKG
jgi:CarD family transcriptional regulator, regulator of rRNA transcription